MNAQALRHLRELRTWLKHTPKKSTKPGTPERDTLMAARAEANDCVQELMRKTHKPERCKSAIKALRAFGTPEQRHLRRAPGAGRKPLNPDGSRARSIEITLAEADIEYLDSRTEGSRSEAIRACIRCAKIHD